LVEDWDGGLVDLGNVFKAADGQVGYVDVVELVELIHWLGLGTWVS